MDILQILFSFSVSLICLFVLSSPSLSFYNRLFSLLAFSSPYYAPLLLFNDSLLLHSLFLFFSFNLLLFFCAFLSSSCFLSPLVDKINGCAKVGRMAGRLWSHGSNGDKWGQRWKRSQGISFSLISYVAITQSHTIIIKLNLDTNDIAFLHVFGKKGQVPMIHNRTGWVQSGVTTYNPDLVLWHTFSLLLSSLLALMWFTS